MSSTANLRRVWMEFLSAIQFLTRTGHLSTDWRQEFIIELGHVPGRGPNRLV